MPRIDNLSHIDNSLTEFAAHLEKNGPIICYKGGMWRKETISERMLCWLRGKEHLRLEAIGQQCCALFDRIERKPILLSHQSDKKMEMQKQHLEQLLRVGAAAQKVLGTSKAHNVSTQLTHLSQRIIALRYRMEAVHGGLGLEAPDLDLYRSLLLQAGKWKVSDPLWPNPQLADREAAKIERVCMYPEFANLLLQHRHIREEFFKWIIRENNHVDAFVQFPSVTKRLKEIFLSVRCGRFGGEMLRLEKRPTADGKGEEKVLSLPFCSKSHAMKYVSILDENAEVVLNGNWRCKIKQIFHSFRQRNHEVGDFELFGSTGITNWNSREWGEWDPTKKEYRRVDLNNDKWWEKVPVFEELTKGEVEQRYRITLADGEWVRCLKATKNRVEHDFAEGFHGYMEMVIPNDQGVYRVYPIGKFPPKFPIKWTEQLAFPASTVRGKVVYLDENVYYAHRQQAISPKVISEDGGLRIMESLKQDIQDSIDDNLAFQIGQKNCAYWVAKICKKEDGNSLLQEYKVNVLDVIPTNPFLGAIFKTIRAFPKSWQGSLLSVAHKCLGGWRTVTVVKNGKIKEKSLKKTTDRYGHVVYLPSILHERIQNGAVDGFITYGAHL